MDNTECGKETNIEGLTEFHLEELRKAQLGDNRALESIIEKYKGLVRAKSRSYFLIGADREDLIQEGMIGLYKAIRDYKPEKYASFRAFAELCITRQIITAIKTATRQKHMPLNSYISLNNSVFDDDSDKTLIDMLGEMSVADPEEMLINREKINGIEGTLDEVLSDLEREVLTLYLQGETYVQISEKIGRRVKSIDNALQRVKRKLEKYLEEDKV